MSDDKNKKVVQTTNPNPPQYPGELQNIHATYRLDGMNFLKWSQLVRTILKGKGKINHITEDGPSEKDEKWDEEDSMIMAWLWGSMAPEISDTCLFLPTAKAIWESIHETYSKAKDAAQVYDVKVKTMAAKQGTKSVTEYANQLKSLWQELDHYRLIKTKCPDDAVVLKNYIEQDRVYDFLVGLNQEFDQVRVQILGRSEVPCFNEVVALIRSEESRRSLMLVTSINDSSAMVAEGNHIIKALERNQKSESGKTIHGGSGGPQNRDNLWCTYCKKSGHIKEKCWKLHGKPPSREWTPRWEQAKGRGHTNVAAEVDNSKNLSEEEIGKLKSLLGNFEKPSGKGFGEDDWTC